MISVCFRQKAERLILHGKRANASTVTPTVSEVKSGKIVLQIFFISYESYDIIINYVMIMIHNAFLQNFKTIILQSTHTDKV